MRTIFFTDRSFLNCHQLKLKDHAVEEIWRPTFFCQVTNYFVPLQRSFRRAILFRDRNQLLKVPLIDVSS